MPAVWYSKIGQHKAPGRNIPAYGRIVLLRWYWHRYLWNRLFIATHFCLLAGLLGRSFRLASGIGNFAAPLDVTKHAEILVSNLQPPAVPWIVDIPHLELAFIQELCTLPGTDIEGALGDGWGGG